jgi:N-ethylmaleimide reductase
MHSAVLLSPLSSATLDVPNRVVMAPMTRRRALLGDVPAALAAEYYAQRASAGLIVGEASLVAANAASYPGSPGLYDDAHVTAWHVVTDAVHTRGGRIFAQLWHAGRFSDPSFLGGMLPVAPSPIAIPGEVTIRGEKRPFTTPRALSLAELPAIVDAFARAARNAIRASFDGVEVHAAQGYLLDQFLRDGANKRDDAYGGPVAHRARLLLEVVDAVAAAVGHAKVGVQLSPTSTLGGMSDTDPLATFEHVATRLSPLGLAYLHVFEPLGPAGRLSPLLRAAFAGPFIANGGYDAASADAAIAAGEADLVSFGRAFIANPDLVARFAAGAPLATPDPATFYGGDARGYTDYPTLPR